MEYLQDLDKLLLPQLSELRNLVYSFLYFSGYITVKPIKYALQLSPHNDKVLHDVDK